MNVAKDADSPSSSTPDLPVEISRELHPSAGMSPEAVERIVRLAQRDAIVHAMQSRKRTSKGNRFTAYTLRILDERRSHHDI